MRQNIALEKFKQHTRLEGSNKCNRFKRGWSTWCNISILYFVRRPLIYLYITTYIWLMHYNRGLNAPNYSAYFHEWGKYGLAISQIMLGIIELQMLKHFFWSPHFLIQWLHKFWAKLCWVDVVIYYKRDFKNQFLTWSFQRKWNWINLDAYN